MLTLNVLQTTLPEFANATPEQEITLNAAIAMVNVTTDGYIGLPEKVRPYALSLAVAAYVSKQGYFSGTGAGVAAGTVKKYKSYNDEIEYFEPSEGQASVSGYQLILDDLIEQYGFPTSSYGSCGCNNQLVREVW